MFKNQYRKNQKILINHMKSSNFYQFLCELFSGSGSTLIVADQLDHVCYCMELDPRYVDVIVTHWEEQTRKVQKFFIINP